MTIFRSTSVDFHFPVPQTLPAGSTRAAESGKQNITGSVYVDLPGPKMKYLSMRYAKRKTLHLQSHHVCQLMLFYFFITLFFKLLYLSFISSSGISFLLGVELSLVPFHRH